MHRLFELVGHPRKKKGNTTRRALKLFRQVTGGNSSLHLRPSLPAKLNLGLGISWDQARPSSLTRTTCSIVRSL